MANSLLKMLEHHDRVQDRNRVLIALLVMICVDTPKDLAPIRVSEVVDAWSENALEGALRYLAVPLTASADERASIWTTKLKPWLTAYWPQKGQRNTARTADEIVKIIIESGSAFSDAVSWSLAVGAVQPIRRLLRLHRLVEPGYHHIKEHPDAVLRLLEGVVTQDSVSRMAIDPSSYSPSSTGSKRRTRLWRERRSSRSSNGSSLSNQGDDGLSRSVRRQL